MYCTVGASTCAPMSCRLPVKASLAVACNLSASRVAVYSSEAVFLRIGAVAIVANQSLTTLERYVNATSGFYAIS